MTAAQRIDQAVTPMTAEGYFASGKGKFHSDGSTKNPRPLTTTSMAKIVEMMAAPQSCEKDKCRWIIPSTLLTRNKAAQLDNGRFLALWGDLDGEKITPTADVAAMVSARLSGARVLAYSSSSATEQRQKARILIPLADHVDGVTYQRMARAFNDLLAELGLEPDRKTESANQVLYLPNRGEFYATSDNGAHSLDPAFFAGEVAAFEAEEAAEEAAIKAARVISAEALQARMAKGEKSPITAFNACYDVETMLRHYGATGRSDRLLSPFSESGSPAIRIKDGKWYSDHGSDVDRGIGQVKDQSCWGDAFDLFKYFEHGNDERAAVIAAGNLTGVTEQNRDAWRAAQLLERQRQQEAAAHQEAEPDQDAEQQPGQAGGLLEIPLGDVMSASLEPVRFALKPWLPRRHVTLFGGHGGIGKSSLALTMGAHVAAGLPFAGHSGDRVPVLFVSLEDEPSIVRLRLRRIIESYNLDPSMVLPGMRLLDGTQAFSALMTEGDGFNDAPVFTKAFHEIEQKAAGTGLIIIDNASDAFDANENSRRAVRAFVRGLAVIARKHDAAVVLLAHIDKAAARNGSQGNSYSGSTAWHNSARSRLALAEQEGVIVLEHEKANLSNRADPLRLSFVDGVLMPESGSDGSVLTTAHFDQAEIVRAFKAAAEAGQRINASLTPGAYCAMKSLELLSDEAYPKAFRSRAGASRAARAIAALKGAGRIKQVSYKTDDRKTKLELVLVEGSAQNGDECADDDA